MTGMKFNAAACAAAVIVTCAGFSATQPALAEKPPIYTSAFSKEAVGGYDPVAYFKDGKPVKGEKKFSTTWHGAEFHFASQANLDAFLAKPDAYAPQYGGYCAWAASQGYTAKGDPNFWKVVNGKLYLNYDEKIQKRWEADVPGLIAKADKNWPQILK